MATILIVDDNANHRALIEQELEDDGYRVAVAHNAAEALRYLTRNRPDLIVSDIALPGTNGIELLQDILATHRAIPVILHSGYASYQQEFMAWAADAFVLKSGDLTALKTAISSVLAERAYESSLREAALTIQKSA